MDVSRAKDIFARENNFIWNIIPAEGTFRNFPVSWYLVESRLLSPYSILYSPPV